MFNNIFRKTLLFIVLAELLSLSGFLVSEFNSIVFFTIVIITLILSLCKLEYGLWIVLTELIIGSKGYLFFFEYGDLVVSIRIALWLIIMSVWLTKLITNAIKTKKVRLEFLKSSYYPYFFILFLFILAGSVNGWLNHNDYSNIFFDLNGWLYFTLIFPAFAISKNKQVLKDFINVTSAAIAWLILKTYLLLFIFSHNLIGMTEEIYRWVRVSGVGEITQIQGGFYRIFFQSHIFILIAFFALLWLLPNIYSNKKTANKIILLSAITCLLSGILLSFSRSFWVGLVVGIVIYFALVTNLFGLRKLLSVISSLFIVSIASVGLIIIIVSFPYPRPLGGFTTTSLLSERAAAISGEAAVSSRWELLPELWKEIIGAPIIGKGFGYTVTYETKDPRALESSATGKYTTYAFEWGWLDIWLKLGLFGLIAYLVLLIKLMEHGIKQISFNQPLNNEELMIMGLITGLLVLSVVNIFTPYLNHPLGIGYIIIASAILSKEKIKT